MEKELRFAACLVAAAMSACTLSIDESPAASRAALVTVEGPRCVRLLGGQTIDVGSVCTRVEGDDLVIEYTTTGGWTLHEAHLWAGLDLADLPQTRTGNPRIGHFPFAVEGLGGVSSHTFVIPLSTFGRSAADERCDPVRALLVAHAVVRRTGSGPMQAETAYGEGPRLVARGNWATSFAIDLVCEPPPPEPPVCEPAFAYLGRGQLCFLDAEEVVTDRWGWTNGPLGAGTYAWTIWGGAEDCDLRRATKVAAVRFEYDGEMVWVRYRTVDGNTFTKIRFYVGSEPFPRDAQGAPTIDPEAYSFVRDVNGSVEETFTISGVSGPIYVIAFAEVCPPEER